VEDPLAEFILSENPPENSALIAQLNEAKDGLIISFDEPVKERRKAKPPQQILTRARFC
jgi:hypothetical protein